MMAFEKLSDDAAADYSMGTLERNSLHPWILALMKNNIDDIKLTNYLPISGIFSVIYELTLSKLWIVKNNKAIEPTKITPDPMAGIDAPIMPFCCMPFMTQAPMFIIV